MMNIKELIRKAYRGKKLFTYQWYWLSKNFMQLPDQFIIDFFPFINWELVYRDFSDWDEEELFKKIFNILYVRSWKASRRHQKKRYWSQSSRVPFDWDEETVFPRFHCRKDGYLCIQDFPDQEYNDTRAFVEDMFVSFYFNFSEHQQYVTMRQINKRISYVPEYLDFNLIDLEYYYLKTYRETLLKERQEYWKKEKKCKDAVKTSRMNVITKEELKRLGMTPLTEYGSIIYPKPSSIYEYLKPLVIENIRVNEKIYGYCDIERTNKYKNDANIKVTYTTDGSTPTINSANVGNKIHLRMTSPIPTLKIHIYKNKRLVALEYIKKRKVLECNSFVYYPSSRELGEDLIGVYNCSDWSHCCFTLKEWDEYKNDPNIKVTYTTDGSIPTIDSADVRKETYFRITSQTPTVNIHVYRYEQLVASWYFTDNQLQTNDGEYNNE